MSQVHALSIYSQRTLNRNSSDGKGFDAELAGSKQSRSYEID
jgi:hypothetical protein